MDAVPAVAASAPAPIPFSHPVAPAVTGGGSLLIAGLLLAAAFAVLWLLHRRGWRGAGLTVIRAEAPGVSVAQRLRLGAGTVAYVLRDGDARLLVIEARSGVQVTPLAPAAPIPAEGAAP